FPPAAWVSPKTSPGWSCSWRRRARAGSPAARSPSTAASCPPHRELNVDFRFSEDEESFRRELRQFLDEELPDWWRGMFVDDARVFPETRRICEALAARGWLTMAWPHEHGGRDTSPWMQAILREEMWAHDEPRGPQYMNLNYIGPCVMRFGTAEQKDRF